MGATRDCKHGQLARSCEVCELEAERDALAAEAERVLRLEEVAEAAKKLVRPCLCCDEGYEDAVCTCTDYPESLAKLRAALAELDAGEVNDAA